MTIKEALFASIAEAVEALRDDLNGLTTAKQAGAGLKTFSEHNRLFLSFREDELDYVFLNPTTFAAETSAGKAFGFSGVGQSFDIWDILKHTVEIHSLRGTPYGIEADLKRLCNTANVTVTAGDAAGWELGVDSPGYTGAGLYDLASALTMLLPTADSLVITVENNSGRTDDEIRQIVRHDIVPIDRSPIIAFI
jgi:hypothetical protein